MMPRDIIILGGLAGIVGNISKTALAWLFYFLGYTQYTFAHITAGYFVDKKFLYNPIALTIGFIGDYFLAGLLGVLIFIMLKLTGFEYAKLKGFGFGGVFYIIFFGVFMALDLTRTSLLTPLPNLLLLFPNLLFGTMTSWFLKKFS